MIRALVAFALLAGMAGAVSASDGLRRVVVSVPIAHGRSIGFLHDLATGEGRDARFTCSAVAKRLALDPAEVADVVLDGQRHCVIDDVESTAVLP